MSVSAHIRVIFLMVLGGLAGQFALSLAPMRMNQEVESGLFLEPRVGRLLGGPYSEFISSIQWVNVVFLYADGVVGTGSLEGLAHGIRMAIELDPEWIQPVEFAGLVLDGQAGTRVEDGIRILEEGVARHPDNWRIRVYLAMLLQSENVSVDSVAGVLLPLTSDTIDAPAYVKRLPITLLALHGNGQDAIEFLSRAIKDAKDPLLRYQFEGKISELLNRKGVKLGADHIDFVASINQILATESLEADHAKSLLVALLDSATQDAAAKEARRMAAQWREHRRSTTAPESESSKNP